MRELGEVYYCCVMFLGYVAKFEAGCVPVSSRPEIPNTIEHLRGISHMKIFILSFECIFQTCNCSYDLVSNSVVS